MNVVKSESCVANSKGASREIKHIPEILEILKLVHVSLVAFNSKEHKSKSK